MLKTKILKASVKQDLMDAASLIKEGELVAVPTETVYGLAADARNISAVQKIYSAKNRPSDHPLIVHIASFEKLSQWAEDIPSSAKILADTFWPGPLTLVLKKAQSVDKVITGGLETVAVRVPNNGALLDLLHILDTGLAAPSANPYKKISPTTAEHVFAGLSGKIAAILDAGPCGVGIESTILDLTKSKPTILRHGPITKLMLEDALNMVVDAPEQHTERISGNMENHYQPNTETLLVSFDQIETILSLPENATKMFGVMHYSDFELIHNNVISQAMTTDKLEYARLMYQALHDLDKQGVNQILIEYPPREEHWNDVLDRLTRAAKRK